MQPEHTPHTLRRRRRRRSAGCRLGVVHLQQSCTRCCCHPQDVLVEREGAAAPTVVHVPARAVASTVPGRAAPADDEQAEQPPPREASYADATQHAAPPEAASPGGASHADVQEPLPGSQPSSPRAAAAKPLPATPPSSPPQPARAQPMPPATAPQLTTNEPPAAVGGAPQGVPGGTQKAGTEVAPAMVSVVAEPGEGEEADGVSPHAAAGPEQPAVQHRTAGQQQPAVAGLPEEQEPAGVSFLGSAPPPEGPRPAAASLQAAAAVQGGPVASQAVGNVVQPAGWASANIPGQLQDLEVGLPGGARRGVGVDMLCCDGMRNMAAVPEQPGSKRGSICSLNSALAACPSQRAPPAPPRAERGAAPACGTACATWSGGRPHH